MLSVRRLSTFFAPVDPAETPAWLYRLSRLLLGLTVLFLPLLYDTRIPEVAGDPRWVMLHLVTLFLVVLILLSRVLAPVGWSFSAPLSVWLVGLAALMAALSVVDAANSALAWWSLKHFLAYCGLFGLIYYFRHDGWYKTLPWLFVAPVLLNGFLGIVQFFGISDSHVTSLLPVWETLGFIDYFKQTARPGGAFANKNLLGSWLVLVLPIALYLFIQAKGRAACLLSFICLTLGGVCLIYTRSRGSWIAAFCALLFFAGWLFVNPPSRQKLASTLGKAKSAALVGCIVLVAWAAASPAGVKGRSLKTTVLEQILSLEKLADKEISPRFAYNANALAIIADHPINGVGLGNFRAIYPLYHDALYDTPHHGYNLYARPQRLHNDVLQFFVELGLLGGLSLLGLFASTLFLAHQLLRPGNIEKAGIFPLFLITAMVGLAVNSLVAFPLQLPTAPGLLFAFAALLAGLSKLHVPKAEKGFSAGFRPGRLLLLSAALGGTMALFLVARDDVQRYRGATYLKQAMSLTAASIFNDATLNYIKMSHDIYPYNPRLGKYRALVYSNYSGDQLTLDDRIEVLGETLGDDPYDAISLVNLASLYIRGAEQSTVGGDEKAAEFSARALDIFAKLQKYAPNDAYTWVVGGDAFLTRDRPKQALEAFERALRIDPQHIAAIRGEMAAKRRLNGAATGPSGGQGDGPPESIAELESGVGGFIEWSDSPWGRVEPNTGGVAMAGDIDGDGRTDLIRDFGPRGTWVKMNNADWVKLNVHSARSMAVADMDGNGLDEVILDLGEHSLWIKWNNRIWQKIHNATGISALAAGDLDGDGRAEVVTDLGNGAGLWFFRAKDRAWRQISTRSTGFLTILDLDHDGRDEVCADLGPGAGLQIFREGQGWTPVRANSRPDTMERAPCAELPGASRN